MRKTRWFALVAVFAMIAAACGDSGSDTPTTGDAGALAGADFSIFGAPTGEEGDALQGFLDVYNTETGSDLTYEGSDDFEAQLRIRVDGGNPPDVSFTPQPASICPFADEGALVSMETLGFDIAELESNHSKFWMDLGLCDDGEHYGLPWFPNFKSIIFYETATFEAEGYDIPETFDDLVSLSETMVSDGYTPWCFGFESGDATGWPGTDWLEDIVVRNSGGDLYADWFKHDIPFNDPAIVEAFDLFGEIMFGEGFVLGGPEAVSAIAFGESPLPLFNDPPSCLMLKQGSFISNFFPEDAAEGQVEFFPFPTIGGNTGALGAGDTLMVFNDSPAVRAALTDWITPTWNCVLASASGGTASDFGGHGVAGVERLPGNKNTDPDCYESDGAKVIAATVTGALAANTFVFDASDLMPPEVGQRSFWDGMVDWTLGTSAQDVADTIEAGWPAG